MGGGVFKNVNPLEWILPPLALTHAAVDAAGVKVETPGSPAAKRGDAEARAQQEAGATQQLLSQQQKKEQQRLSESDPENVRRRAVASSRSLGESGKRASEYLAGI